MTFQGQLNEPNFTFLEQTAFSHAATSGKEGTTICSINISRTQLFRSIYCGVFYNTSIASRVFYDVVFSLKGTAVGSLRQTEVNINSSNQLQVGEYAAYIGYPSYANPTIGSGADPGQQEDMVYVRYKTASAGNVYGLRPFHVTADADRADLVIKGNWTGTIITDFCYLGILSSTLK